MGNDSDFGIGPIAAITDRDEQILAQARLAWVSIHPDVHALILAAVNEAAAEQPVSDEDHEDLVLELLNIRHGLDEAEWRLSVLLVMVQWRYHDAYS